ncbi:MAG: hypothetical protein M1829_000554 [Trizodia sp. TS-e1964]|nr:MAG: hypothetical protein M1829_000554 [Trizodia sp. TS-e1964]
MKGKLGVAAPINKPDKLNTTSIDNSDSDATLTQDSKSGLRRISRDIAKRRSQPPSDDSDDSSDVSTPPAKRRKRRKPRSERTTSKANDKPNSAEVAPTLRIKIPDNNLKTGSIVTGQAHTLETLFKRTSPQPSHAQGPKISVEPVSTFTFFGPDADDGIPPLPNTPFSARDINERSVRSAAPTPDTAAPGKAFSGLWPRKRSKDTASDDTPASSANRTKLEVPGGNKINGAFGNNKMYTVENDKEFEAYFYEHRGEMNRAWKKRRRECLKIARQGENKKKGPKLTNRNQMDIKS